MLRPRPIDQKWLVLLVMVLSLLPAKAQQADSSNRSWSFSASGYYYIVPQDQNLFSAVVSASHRKLYLETRFNYEDRQTLSVFAGWVFEKPGKFQLSVTPMAGFMAGRSQGVIPAVEIDAAWRFLSFYSETEYVFDFAGRENDYLYVWGELAASPSEAWKLGFSYQKTKLYQSGVVVQTGPMIKYAFWKLTAGLYYFNPFSNSDLLVISLGFDF